MEKISVRIKKKVHFNNKSVSRETDSITAVTWRGAGTEKARQSSNANRVAANRPWTPVTGPFELGTLDSYLFLREYGYLEK